MLVILNITRKSDQLNIFTGNFAFFQEMCVYNNLLGVTKMIF